MIEDQMTDADFRVQQRLDAGELVFSLALGAPDIALDASATL